MGSLTGLPGPRPTSPQGLPQSLNTSSYPQQLVTGRGDHASLVQLYPQGHTLGYSNFTLRIVLPSQVVSSKVVVVLLANLTSYSDIQLYPITAHPDLFFGSPNPITGVIHKCMIISDVYFLSCPFERKKMPRQRPCFKATSSGQGQDTMRTFL